MKSRYHWLIVAVCLYIPQTQATVAINDFYALPPTKIHLDDCLRNTLRLHQGNIEKQNLRHRDNRFIMQYEIYVRDGTRWLVSCNLDTGNLVDEQHW